MLKFVKLVILINAFQTPIWWVPAASRTLTLLIMYELRMCNIFSGSWCIHFNWSSHEYKFYLWKGQILKVLVNGLWRLIGGLPLTFSSVDLLSLIFTEIVYRTSFSSYCMTLEKILVSSFQRKKMKGYH